MNVVLFEDRLVDQLFPITLTRPAYAMSCGALRLVDLAASLKGNLGGVVREYLTDFQQDYFKTFAYDPGSPTIWLNARIVPHARAFDQLRALAAEGKPFCIMEGGSVVAALSGEGIPLERRSLLDQLSRFEPTHQGGAHERPLRLIDYPHTLVAEHSRVIGDNISYLLNGGGYREIANGVFSSGSRSTDPFVSYDTSKGPVILEEGVTVSPFSHIIGPVRLGQNVHVSPHSVLKGPICVGHGSKVGGEVSRSVIESFSNKVHFGYLGTAYVGSWVNLGAGTSNSNLKNTYGTIRVEYGDRKVDTGQQFFGCVIGDYTKTAIHASIYTGKILGVCSNVYGAVTSNVPSFANYAKSFGDITEQPVDVMEVVQQRVFARRGKDQEERHRQLLRSIYQIEAPKRKLANHPPSL